jgi:hypothetical protein
MAIILLIDVCISLLQNKFIVEPKRKRAELMRQPDNSDLTRLFAISLFLYTTKQFFNYKMNYIFLKLLCSVIKDLFV